MATDSKNKTPKKKTSKSQEVKTRKDKHRRRALPIWLRIIIVLFLSILALAVGLMIGYGVLGGGNPLEVFDWSIWEQIIDIMTGSGAE